MKVLTENCDPKLAEDPKLPYTAYLIQYADKEVVKYDLTVGDSKVEIFDHYYDKYKNVMSMIQSNGRVNPKLWNAPKAKKPRAPKQPPKQPPKQGQKK
tara:strand:+ start:1426 stop:1719 length:294 start_codon:yes stop_codon:yes gene_type:complete